MRDAPTRAAALDPVVLAAATAQDGLLTRRQLIELGVSRHEVAAQVRARRWRLLGDVVVLHRGGLSRSQQHWFAVLHATANSDDAAGLASFTALEVAGLRGWDREETHLLVRRSRWIRPRAGLVVHESRRFVPERDLLRRGGPPRTAAGRSAVDAAAWSSSRRTAAGVIAAVAQQGLCTSDELQGALATAGRVRHVALLRRVIADVGGGADSLAEMEMASLIRRAGLPAPRRQAFRRDASGRRRYVDLEVDLPDGTVLAIEVDGSHHLDVRHWWSDQQRQNDLAEAGRLLARYPAVVVRTEPEAVVASLRRLAAPHL